MSASEHDSKREDEVSLEMEQFFPFQLTQLQARVSDSIADIYTGHFALSKHEWRIVAVLGAGQSLSAKDIGLMINLEKMQTSRAIAKMLDRSLLMKDSHKHDRRSSLLKLSPEGIKIHQELAPMILAREQALMSILSSYEQVKLSQMFKKLMSRADELLHNG
ncbi:MarR family winged helix-turn-helix transcriptional regulator [Shewanella woodyi]|uniref:Transcriptional regulator, MarR family n=1 Tax=Shewanella woodyi (strain ATCC 51908 / MS32) TaxID=392500 RepID=B1KDC9_SHEWM|nr:winged helix DNA-binding protein [Shewanella woodyi]ACA84930.1 transcriptional regulator, MarR family [Shewanella woodyi ATCC 51908]